MKKIKQVWLTRQEAAERLRVSPHTVDRWTREGRLTKYKVADLQSVRFDADQVDELVQPISQD
jgi:excisionase family DNA binding protein